MEMNVAVPITYVLFFILLLVAGIVGCLVRSCCVCLDKDEKRKAAVAQQDPEAIVTDPAKGAISKSIHRVPDLQDISAKVHPSGQGTSMPIVTITKPVVDMDRMVSHQQSLCLPSSALCDMVTSCTSRDPLRVATHGRPVSFPTPNAIVIVPALQRKPKIRRTGDYDDLYTVSSWSNSI